MSRKIIISGSLAYDRIMDFPGYFSDHILPDKIHSLNVSFQVDGMREKFGGTAGNIAYALTLEPVGFLINTFWFMLLLLKVIEPQGWTKALLASLTTAVVSELFFNVLLGAQIPTGILGF